MVTQPNADDEGAWTTLLPELVALLELTPDGEDRFAAGHSVASVTTGHVFGGLVAAQAVMAAGRTVPAGRTIHSLHGYFLRPGDAAVPLHLEVDRTRDGRSFSHRRVSAVQDGRVIAEFTCSWAIPRAGLAHQTTAPAAPDPETIRPDHEVLRDLPVGMTRYGTSPDAFDLRTVGLGPGWFESKAPAGEPTLVWKRAAGAVPDDALLHAALFTFASDMRILHPVLRPHGLAMYGVDVRPATIDHAVWFHRPVRVEDWLLWQCESPWAGDGRGFVRAKVYGTDGTLVAEAAQEGLIGVG